jgi:uncharacterized protein (TIGR02466 family)
MQINREDWWATPVWYFDIPIQEVDYNKVAEECYLEKSKSEGRTVSNRIGWQSHDIYANSEIPNISNLIKTIEMYSKNIFQDYGIKKEFNLVINNSWININTPGSYNEFHIHHNCVLSGVYYVSAPENSGNVVIYNNSIMQFINASYLDTNNKNTYPEVVYKPVTGRVIIFPGWLPHSVQPNNSKEDRISIAFNCAI